MFIVDENGNIQTIQGDSGKLVVGNIDDTKNYKVYFSIYDSKRNIISENVTSSNYRSEMTIFIPASFTDKLVVKKNEESAEYYYGIKLCWDEEINGATQHLEDTAVIGESGIDELNVITVYPKRTEGTKEETEEGDDNG